MDFNKVDEGHPDYAPGEEPLHFFYNREERISKAPLIVQEYYAGRGPRPVKGLFKSLFSTRGNRFMFSSIIVFAAFIWIFSFISGRNVSRIGGTTVALSAFSYDDSIYSSIKFDALKMNSDSSKKDLKSNQESSKMIQIPVQVVFIAYESSGMECDRKIIDDVFVGDELFIRTIFSDYDIIKVSCEVTMGVESKKFDAKIERH